MIDRPLATDRLVGVELTNGWRIVDRIEIDQGRSGGNFSVGFLAGHDDGRQGFVKALDLGKVLSTNEDHALETLEFLLDSFNYERRLLLKCASRGMNRIVRLIDSGHLEINDTTLQYPRVDYLICEIADGDVRKFLHFSEGIDVAWRMRCLHQTAVGLQQLHSARISHQDLKPSNILMFEEGREVKLADLGRAVDRDVDAPYEDFGIAGDKGYALPELLYGFVSPEWATRRLACDLYHLGSLGFFLFTGVHAVAAMLGELPVSHQPYHFSNEAWDGPFEDVVPLLEEALARNLRDIRKQLVMMTTEDVSDALVAVLGWLCAPDPAKRGHPRDRNTLTPHSVQRFVSTFNMLATKAGIQILRGKH